MLENTQTATATVQPTNLYTPEQIAADMSQSSVVALYNAGSKQTEIARLKGLTHQNVWHILDKAFKSGAAVKREKVAAPRASGAEQALQAQQAINQMNGLPTPAAPAPVAAPATLAINNAIATVLACLDIEAADLRNLSEARLAKIADTMATVNRVELYKLAHRVDPVVLAQQRSKVEAAAACLRELGEQFGFHVIEAHPLPIREELTRLETAAVIELSAPAFTLGDYVDYPVTEAPAVEAAPAVVATKARHTKH